MKLTYNDRQHVYWLDGKRCKSVSAVAKIPEDVFGLEQWRKRQVAIGMALSPPLVERAAAHYDDRDQLDRIAEEAMAIAKSHEAAGRGTAAHRITERVDLGQLVVDTPLADAVRTAWLAALDSAGLEIVPDLVERIVVFPDQLVAGRFDRYVRRRSDGRLVVLDLKTGETAVRYPHSIATQLAMYANAPLMAGPLDDGSTCEFEPLPYDLDREHGLIVHMPAEAAVEVHEVDIHAGWEIVEKVIFPILAWRKRRDLIRPLVQPETVVTSDRTSWLVDRLKVLGGDDRARTLVARQWPDGCPTKPAWTDEQIDAIAAELNSVEDQVRAPFPPVDPTKETPASAPILDEEPAAPRLERPDLDDGRMMQPEDVDALRKAIAETDEPHRLAAQRWALQARVDGFPFDPTPYGMTLRAWSIARAALICARDLPDEPAVRGALTAIIGQLHRSWRTGAVLGSLTVDQATQLTDLVARFIAGDQETHHQILIGF